MGYTYNMKNETTPMTLSPAAQAVLDAYCTEADRLDREVSHEEMLAALRAAADIVDDREASRQLDAIAYELEAQ
jgi:hypothetical protein